MADEIFDRMMKPGEAEAREVAALRDERAMVAGLRDAQRDDADKAALADRLAAIDAEIDRLTPKGGER